MNWEGNVLKKNILLKFKKEKSNSSRNIGKNNITINNTGDNNIIKTDFNIVDGLADITNKYWSECYNWCYLISRSEEKHIVYVIKNKLINDGDIIHKLELDSIWFEENDNSQVIISRYVLKFFINYWENNMYKYKIPENIVTTIADKPIINSILDDIFYKLNLDKKIINFFKRKYEFNKYKWYYKKNV